MLSLWYNIINYFKPEDSLDNLKNIIKNIDNKDYLKTLKIDEHRIIYIENIKACSVQRFNIHDYINDLVNIKTENDKVTFKFLKSSLKFMKKKLRNNNNEFYDEERKIYYYIKNKIIYSTLICLYKIEYY
jgi:hypothetical protein